MKKFICLIIFILFTGIIILHQYNLNKSKDINYAIEQYFTTGIFNEYKMYDISNKTLYFSNGVDAFVKVNGLSNGKPHRSINYEVFLEKNKKGIWKVSKVYPY
ncbi:hypothetical protein KM800_13270 [Clostridium tyrobutyricum]|uniref:hypothetical protein n=1 Tax=Clostridium tyrobutyricum TaxID=1519 RepID=UPI001C38AF44|nr:hypothetical protein [Clostridium tyrobutyricum]MBV4420275.1 hypothetical protein [Clostridium tyrobutyricum]